MIKRSRDIQKAAKQAIFSLHRGENDQAAARLQQAEKAAEELLPVIKESPGLRYGSFSNAMEEVRDILLRHFVALLARTFDSQQGLWVPCPVLPCAGKCLILFISLCLGRGWKYQRAL